MKWTFVGNRRRADLTVTEPERQAADPIFTVRLLTDSGKPDGAFQSGADMAYMGPNGSLAWEQIRRWTGASLAAAPRKIAEYLQPRALIRRARGKVSRKGK